MSKSMWSEILATRNPVRAAEQLPPSTGVADIDAMIDRAGTFATTYKQTLKDRDQAKADLKRAEEADLAAEVAATVDGGRAPKPTAPAARDALAAAERAVKVAGGAVNAHLVRLHDARQDRRHDLVTVAESDAQAAAAGIEEALAALAAAAQAHLDAHARLRWAGTGTWSRPLPLVDGQRLDVVIGELRRNLVGAEEQATARTLTPTG